MTSSSTHFPHAIAPTNPVHHDDTLTSLTFHSSPPPSLAARLGKKASKVRLCKEVDGMDGDTEERSLPEHTRDPEAALVNVGKKKQDWFLSEKQRLTDGARWCLVHRSFVKSRSCRDRTTSHGGRIRARSARVYIFSISRETRDHISSNFLEPQLYSIRPTYTTFSSADGCGDGRWTDSGAFICAHG